MRFLLLDANILIGAFDSKPDDKKYQKDRELVNELMLRDDVKIAITPLIRYEVLRGLKNLDFLEMQEILDDFMEFNIDKNISYQSAQIFHKIPSTKLLDEFQRKTTSIILIFFIMWFQKLTILSY